MGEGGQQAEAAEERGIVRSYYDQSYIDHLKNGDIVIAQAWSGDIFQADLNSSTATSSCSSRTRAACSGPTTCASPCTRPEPRAAMTLMDYFYAPDIEAVVEYYNDYVCPVPDASRFLLHPTGWGATALKDMAPEIGLPTKVTADARRCSRRRPTSRTPVAITSTRARKSWTRGTTCSCPSPRAPSAAPAHQARMEVPPMTHPNDSASQNPGPDPSLVRG